MLKSHFTPYCNSCLLEERLCGESLRAMFLLGGLCVLEQGPSQPGSTPELCGTSMVELLGPARDCASQFSPIAVPLVMSDVTRLATECRLAKRTVRWLVGSPGRPRSCGIGGLR